MSVKAETSYGFDTVKWLSIWALLAVGVFGFYHFADALMIFRVLGLLAIVGVVIGIALTTAKGQSAWGFTQETQIEVRKVVWPSRKETIQTTLIVLVMVLIMAILIWMVDSLLFWIVQTLTN